MPEWSWKASSHPLCDAVIQVKFSSVLINEIHSKVNSFGIIENYCQATFGQ